MYPSGGFVLIFHVSSTTTLPLDARLGKLVSPLGGVIAQLEQLAAGSTRSADTVTLARLGEVGELRGAGAARFGAELDGIGCDPDPAAAARIAAIEACERYAAAVWDERAWVTDTASALGAEAIDLDGLACCSPRELAHPDYPLAGWDPDEPLRWVSGWSLLSGQPLWVPAVMAHLGMRVVHPVESFWLQSSSGCAAGESEAAALLAACLELVERDACAIAWLQRLRLPRLKPAAEGSGRAAGPLERRLAGDRDRERITLFDATTDLGIPTVLAVLVPAPDAPPFPAFGAASALSLERAAERALRELSIFRACLWPHVGAHRPLPAAAFAHLFEPPGRPAPLAPVRRRLDRGSLERQLATVVELLVAECGELLAVELTPPELAGSGLRVVRVIAPALIPFLAHPRVRYLGSRRLYDVPPRMGHPVSSEEGLNPWPSPLL